MVRGDMLRTGTDMTARLEGWPDKGERFAEAGRVICRVPEPDAIRELRDLLGRAVYGVSTHAETGADTFRCPFCGRDNISGLDEQHNDGCPLPAVFDKYRDA